MTETSLCHYELEELPSLNGLCILLVQVVPTTVTLALALG